MACNPRKVDIPNNRLIDEVGIRPELYDRTLPGYQKYELKQDLWKEIARKLFPEYWKQWDKMEKREIVMGLQKRWANLRACYARELKRQVKIKMGDPSITDGDKKYRYYNSMKFLKNFMCVKFDGGQDIQEFIIQYNQSDTDDNAPKSLMSVNVNGGQEHGGQQFLQEDNEMDNENSPTRFTTVNVNGGQEFIRQQILQDGNESNNEENSPMSPVAEGEEEGEAEVEYEEQYLDETVVENEVELEESNDSDVDYKVPVKINRRGSDVECHIPKKIIRKDSDVQYHAPPKRIRKDSEVEYLTPKINRKRSNVGCHVSAKRIRNEKANGVVIEPFKKTDESISSDQDTNFALSLIPMLKRLTFNQKIKAQIEILQVFQRLTEND